MASGTRQPKQLMFRRWLIDQLKLTKWPRRLDQSRAELAEALGVQLDVLTVAEQELRAEEAATGRVPRQLGSSRNFDSVTLLSIEIALPQAVWTDWEAYCKRRQLPPSVLLRSLVHTYLSSAREPAWVGATWRYRGRHERITWPGKKKKWPLTVFSSVPRGVDVALDQRAKAQGVTRTAILRGLVIDLLEGRTRRIPIIAPRAMWNDPARYAVAAKENKS